MKTIRLPLAALLVAGTTAATAQISRTELARAPLDGIARGAGAIVRVELPPGGSTDRHRHPGQEYVYVVGGSLVIEPDGSAPVRLEAGEARVNPANEVHRVRNPSRRRAALVIVVALVPEGSAAVIPAE
jgi:quercetin dioxygenase-like cupin family protein